MADSSLTAAIRFTSDGYDLRGPKLMGRQAAGNGFLRAAVHAPRDGPLTGYGPDSAAAAAFAELVRTFDPSAETDWIRSDQLDRFNAARVCYLPDPWLGADARLRLRAGLARHSLCGVTHTLSRHRRPTPSSTT